MKTLTALVLSAMIGITSLMPIKKTKATDNIINGNISSIIATNFVAPMGYVLGSGPVNQNTTSINLKDRISLFIWSNYDLKDKGMHEIDTGLLYNHPIKDNLSLRVGYQHWAYPSKLLGEYDNLFDIGINYNGKVNADIFLQHITAHGNTKNGNMIHGTISKPVQLKKSISVIPNINSAYLDNFYGDKGLSHITPGIEISCLIGKATLSAFLKRQFGFINATKNKTYCGISLQSNF